MSHCDAGVPQRPFSCNQSRDSPCSDQKIFQLFSQQVLFQDFEIIFREKNFSDFQTNLSPGIAMRFQRHKLRFTCNQRRRTLPVRIAWKRDWSSCVSLRCGSASRGKNLSESKKFFNFFQNRFSPCFRTLRLFKGKKIFPTNLSPGIAMQFQRQKLPFTCNQRRRTLPFRIAWKGDWSSCVSLRCGSASRGRNLSKSKNFFNFFQNRFSPCFRTLRLFQGKKFFLLSDQSESRYRNAIPKA